jgi:hypothetical protein
MTPEAQRIAIAEACGWEGPFKHWHFGQLLGFRYRGKGIEQNVPDYLNDLNAMHEAEKVLVNHDYAKYEFVLGEVCDKWTKENLMGATLMQSTSVSATAAQRAEAFLRTLNLWKGT